MSGLLETVRRNFFSFLKQHFSLHILLPEVFLFISFGLFGRSSVCDGAAESSQIQIEQSGDEAATGGPKAPACTSQTALNISLSGFPSKKTT